MAEDAESLELALTLPIGEDLTPLPEYKAASTLSLDFDGLLSKPLLVYEDLTSGCGGQTWPAGIMLAKHILRYHRDELRDARM
jgi:protein N-lysine methyltransferase METTL21A